MEKYNSEMSNSEKLNYMISKYDFDASIILDIGKRLGDFALSRPSDEAMEAYTGRQVRFLENIINFRGESAEK